MSEEDGDTAAPAPTFLVDSWQMLATHTPARIALGRCGASLPTREVLKFGLAHAQARDAVHLVMDTAAIVAAVKALGWDAIEVTSQAATREAYLRRPDLGRRLAQDDRETLLERRVGPYDLVMVIGDGLSATALHANIEPFLAALKPHLDAAGYRVAPVAVATNARVALSDDVVECFEASAAIMLVGERPGLSSPDSLGAYFTFAPSHGRSDAERNCVSNIRRAGLSYELAAFKLGWLVREAFRLGHSGVRLKDKSDAAWLAHQSAKAISPIR